MSVRSTTEPGTDLREPLAGRLGVAARARVEAEYSRDAMRRRFEDFYRDLVRGTPTASRVVSSTGTTLLAAAVIGAACLLIVFVVAIRAQRRDVSRVLREGTT